MINQNRYVKIVSGVGAGAAVAQRRLILRLITQNNIIPPGIVAEFSSPEAVGAYFGTQTEEYKRAQAYFSFISKSIRSPGLISFARWVNSAIAPVISGDATPKSMGAFTAVSNGSINFDIDGVSVLVSGISLTGATDFSNVASLIQTALNADANLQLKTATVTYMAVTQQFIFNGGVTGSGVVKVGTAPGTDLGAILGWNTSGAVASPGQAADTPDQAVAKSAGISNNFGSFAFVTPATALTNSDIETIAAWNHSQNNMYMYLTRTTIANMAALYALVKGYSGCALNIVGIVDDFIEQSAGEILSATDYESVNATQNYMYYQFPNRNTTVSDDTVADQCDLNRCNYIGVTQTAGQQLAFFQRGVLCGGSQAAVDMNTYANEMWLKSAISARVLQAFLSMPSISTDVDGQASLLAVIQDVLDKAKDNGTFARGKTLSAVQQQYITQVTGDPMAWRQVATLGFWINMSIESYVAPGGLTEYKAKYLLIYSKDDQIRMVDGTDTLI